MTAAAAAAAKAEHKARLEIYEDKMAIAQSEKTDSFDKRDFPVMETGDSGSYPGLDTQDLGGDDSDALGTSTIAKNDDVNGTKYQSARQTNSSLETHHGSNK